MYKITNSLGPTERVVIVFVVSQEVLTVDCHCYGQKIFHSKVATCEFLFEC